MYKAKMTEFNLDYAAGYEIEERDILSAADVIYVERNRPSTRTTTMATDRGTARPNKANALQHRPKPGSTGKKGKGPSSSRACKYECITCKAFLNKPGQYHYLTACPVLVSKLAEKSPKSAAAKGTEVPPESSTSRTKVHFSRRRPDTSDDSDYWQGVMTEPKANMLVAAINGDDTNFASLDMENSNQASLHAWTPTRPTFEPDENDISFSDIFDLASGDGTPVPQTAQPCDNLFVADIMDTNVALSFGAEGRTPDFGLGDETPPPRSSGRNKIPLEVDIDLTVISALSDAEGVCDGGIPTPPPCDAHARSVKAISVDVISSTSGTENLNPDPSGNGTPSPTTTTTMPPPRLLERQPTSSAATFSVKEDFFGNDTDSIYARTIEIDLDSGATVFTYPYAQDLFNVDYNRRATLKTADGTAHVTQGSGTLLLQVLDSEGRQHVLTIHDVHIAPFLSESLCSIHHILKYVDNVDFKNCYVYNDGDKYPFRWVRSGYYWEVTVLQPTYYGKISRVLARESSDY